MSTLPRRAALLALAACLLLPASALATHMGNYGYNPVEHDDQGRSAEPDAQRTSVLGPALENCIVSPDLGPGCIPDGALPPPPAGHSALLAPGCTDDAGRQPSGLCGLWTVGAGNQNAGFGIGVPPQTLGTPGMTTGAPGRFSLTKATVVRFLDSRVDAQFSSPAGGVQYLDLNAKLQDSGLAQALAGVDGNFGSRAIMPLGNALWAWYGTWADKNGNGVIDHLRGPTECTISTCPPDGGVASANEFTWIGRCIQFNGQAAPPGQRYCNFQADTLLPTWVYPGDHHAFCGFGLAPPDPQCGVVPGDAPGKSFLLLALGPCPGEDCADFAEDNQAYLWGDPLFGEQHSRHVDTNGGGGFGAIWGMGDRTGEPLATGRQWVFGNGFSTWFYDQSLLLSTVVVTGVTTEAPVANLETDFDLAKLSSVDVDNYRTWSPAAEELLAGAVKPAARGAWIVSRDLVAAEDATAEAGRLAPGTRLTYDECDPHLGVCLGTDSAPTTGRLLDRIMDPGWAKEPNHASDAYPAATRGTCAGDDAGFRTHQGQCNGYAAHAAAPRAWMDVQEFNAWYPSIAWRTPTGQCILCITAPPSALPDLPDGVRDADTHRRVLDPGSHVFGGVYGAWQDRPQVHAEEALDLLGTVTSLGLAYRTEDYTMAPDGWVGDIVNSTGFTRVGGFLPEACVVYGAFATFEYAQCHPYADGNLDSSIFGGGSAQDYADDEFQAGEKNGGEGPLGHWLLRLTPVDGCWSVPVVVWRGFDTWTMGNLDDLDDFTGLCATITMDLGEGTTGTFAARDLLLLPEGNREEAVLSEVQGTVTVRDGGVVIVREPVRDVDLYAPWTAP